MSKEEENVGPFSFTAVSGSRASEEIPDSPELKALKAELAMFRSGAEWLAKELMNSAFTLHTDEDGEEQVVPVKEIERLTGMKFASPIKPIDWDKVEQACDLTEEEKAYSKEFRSRKE